MSRGLPQLVGPLVAVACLTLASQASAFCRKTTCEGDGCPTDKRGCPAEGEALKWGKLPLHYRFHNRPPRLLLREEARAAIREAFHRWSDTICADGRRTSLRFVEDDDVAEDKPLEKDAVGVNPYTIYFRDYGWPHTGVDETLALTTHNFRAGSGFIEYADMEVNSGATRGGRSGFSTDEADEDGKDLQAVMTHEAGHYIGLAHSKEDKSIMAPSYCAATTDRCKKGKVAERRLAPDDILAVCTLYPPDGIPEEEVRPETGGLTCAARTPARPGNAWALGSLLVPVLVWWRRRRRRA